MLYVLPATDWVGWWGGSMWCVSCGVGGGFDGRDDAGLGVVGGGGARWWGAGGRRQRVGGKGVRGVGECERARWGGKFGQA